MRYADQGIHFLISSYNCYMLSSAMDTATEEHQAVMVNEAEIVAASSVIVPRRVSIKKEALPGEDRKRPTLDDETQRRGKRMMGVLLGTLQAPKGTRHAATLTQEQTQKKQQVDERLRQKLAEERALLEKTMEEEAQRRREAHLEKERIEGERLEAKWTEHRALLQSSPFKRTETKPSLFWSPAL